jgi:hypothetical protein
MVLGVQCINMEPKGGVNAVMRTKLVGYLERIQSSHILYSMYSNTKEIKAGNLHGCDTEPSLKCVYLIF